MRHRSRLLLPVLASALPLTHLGGQTTPTPPSTDRITVTDEPEARRLVIALGPIDLPAHASHHELEQIPIQTGTLPFDLAIHGFRVELVDGEGRAVPQELLHHFNLLDPDSRELFLPIMRRVLAASHETEPQSLPGWLLGIPMRGNRPFLALTMLHNPTSRSYEDVSVRLVLDYVRGRPLYRIYPFHLDVMFPMGSKAFDLPPGRSVRSYEASPAIAGGIVGIGGHLHRYAERLELLDVTTDRVLYRVEPEVDEGGHVASVPAYRYGGDGMGLPIYPGYRYRVSVTYFNPTGRTIPGGGMGSVAGGFIPFEPWPEADPADPLFAADYRWVLEESLTHTMNETGEHGEGYRHETGGGASAGTRSPPTHRPAPIRHPP